MTASRRLKTTENRRAPALPDVVLDTPVKKGEHWPRRSGRTPVNVNALSMAVRSQIVDSKASMGAPGVSSAQLSRSEREAFRAWRRRLARAGGDPMRFAPRSGALEWV